MRPPAPPAVVLCLIVATLAPIAGAAPSSPDESIDFDRDIRPILEESCFRCHGPHAKRIRSGLMLAGREALLLGGDSGPSVVPGDVDGSLLLRMVRYESEDFEMPPTGPLEAEQVKLLERWVAEGLVWPGGDEAPLDHRGIDMDEGRQWWAFRPVVRPDVPALLGTTPAQAARNPIDAFLLAALAEQGLSAAPAADERALVRRAYVDLLGVQPTPEELKAYRADTRSDRWERLLDELLARPEYGERWGRAWLDVVRYAQTNGYERDEEKYFIWRYRDYVIRAFNDDKPYDEFLREQLAGDELDEVTRDSLIATGFYALGIWDTEPNDPEQAVWDAQDDILRTITEGMMAVTVGCARCHDHRFDPVRQKDYFSLLAFVRNVEPYRKPSFNFESKAYRALDSGLSARERWEADRVERAERLTLERARMADAFMMKYIEANLASLTRRKPDFKLEDYKPRAAAAELGVSELKVKRALAMEDRIELFLVDEEIRTIEASYEGDVDWALCVAETGPEPLETHVLKRGKASSPLEQVSAAFLPVMCPDDESASPTFEVRGADGRETTGQRRALADWIASPEHPTTARVMVNRIWQGHFGSGLVKTPNDFGATGDRPSHPLLLDWLADEFVARGWSVKDMHRLIMNSAAYRCASDVQNAAATTLDPENRLLWRQNMRRLDAESLHDSMLRISGKLNPEPGGRGFFPALSLEAMAGASRPGSGWKVSKTAERNRRAVYSYVKRGMLVPFFMVFDAIDPTSSQGKRASTTVASQSLTLLNGEFANRVALEMARGLLAECGEDRERLLRGVYEQVMLREPTPEELLIATDFLARQERGFAALQPTITFRAAVPKRLEINYLRELEPEGCLDGPRASWTYSKGLWGNEYNMTRERLAELGPYALLDAPQFKNGRLRFDLTLEKGCKSAAFLMRARGDGARLQGLQVVFDAVEDELRLVHLNGRETKVLERVPFSLTSGEPHSIGIQLHAKRLMLSVDGELRLNHESDFLKPGSGVFGVRTRGAAMHLCDLSIQAGGVQTQVEPDNPGEPLERALALFCLTAFNLNEFLYVD